jgi:hypothetical protein
MALGWTQPLIEMSTKNILEGKGWPEYKADVTDIRDLFSRKSGRLDGSESCGLPRLVAEISLLLLCIMN